MPRRCAMGHLETDPQGTKIVSLRADEMLMFAYGGRIEEKR